MKSLFPEMKKGAILSKCRRYRYVLWRKWKPNGMKLMVIGLNPSTADETEDDPTIRKCVGFAKLAGYGCLYMLNLFAFRATNPKDMLAAEDPVGPLNDDYLIRYFNKSHAIIAAWGCDGKYLSRDADVYSLLCNRKNDDYKLLCFGTAKDGHPKHPLFLPYDSELVIYEREK